MYNKRDRKPCIYCNKEISINNYAGHIRNTHKEKTISHNCHICKQFFSDREKLVRHIAGCAKGKKYDQNNNAISRKEKFYNHYKTDEQLKQEGWKMDTFNDHRIGGLNFEHANVCSSFNDDNFNIILNSILKSIGTFNKVKLILTYKCEFFIYEEEVSNSLQLRHFDIDSEGYNINNRTEVKD